MAFVSLALVMVVLFAVCRWAGHTLSHHYQDGWEVAAVAAVAAMGLGAFAALWAAQALAAEGGVMSTIGLVGAGGGLFAGYLRGERV
jgi:hypothetical protein